MGTSLRIQQFLVENILCNKLNIQNSSLCNIGIYCTLGREYFPRPPASGNIPTLDTIYTDIPLGRVEYLVYVCLSWSKKRRRNYVGQTRAAQSQYWAVKSDQRHPYYSFRLYARAAIAWTEKKRSLRNEKLKANRAS